LYGFTAGATQKAGPVDLDYTVNLGGTRQSVIGYNTTDFEYDGPGGNGYNIRYNSSNTATPVYHYLQSSDSAGAMNAGNYAMRVTPCPMDSPPVGTSAGR